jgi:LPXTG-motif cell wall-anchored protein
MPFRDHRRWAVGAIAAVSILAATFVALSTGFASAATCDASRYINGGKLDVTSYLQCEQPTASPNSTPPGGTVHFSGGGFASNSQVTIELHSTPVVLGTTTTDDVGGFTYDAVIPSNMPPGVHELMAIGVDPNGNPLTDEMEITVASNSTLPVTGTDSVEYVGLALALVALGSAAVWGSRRRQTTAVAADD